MVNMWLKRLPCYLFFFSTLLTLLSSRLRLFDFQSEQTFFQVFYFLKLHKKHCQTNKTTPNVVPINPTQSSEQNKSYCWNSRALWVPSMHFTINKLCSYRHIDLIWTFLLFLSLLLVICCTVIFLKGSYNAFVVWTEMCVGSLCTQPPYNAKNPPSIFFVIY